MNKKVFIGSLLCAIGFTGIFGFSTGSAFGLFENSKIDLPLRSVSFDRSGDMQGSQHSMSVEMLDDESALVCYEDASWHHEVVQVKEYIVPKTILEDIKTIFNDNDLAKCEKAPQSKYFVHDAATCSYAFDFKTKRIRFSSGQELPQGSNEALRKISSFVSEACQKGERIPGLYFEKDAEGNMPSRYAVQKGKVAIKVVCYRKNSLEIAISNDLDEEKEISLQSKITELGNPNVIVAERITDEKDKLPQHYNDTYYWKLNKRLEVGKYKLSFGEYITEFEIK